MCPQVLDGEMPSGVDVGVAERAGAGSGPVGRDWNVAAAAGAAVRVGRGIALVQGNGPGC